MLDLILAILMFALQTRTANVLQRFPSTLISVRSPDGRLEAVNRDSDQEVDGAFHHLTIERTVDRKVCMKYTYRRAVEVLWSPDSRLLLVNDHTGSGVSSAFLLVTSSGQIKDIERSITKTRTGSALLRDAYHCQFEGMRFISRSKLEVILYGSLLTRDRPACFTYDYHKDAATPRVCSSFAIKHIRDHLK